MTAPLFLNQINRPLSLHVITNKILNAIDNNEMDKIEKYIDEIFKQYNVSRDFFWMLYCYAKESKQIEISTYLQQIMNAEFNY